MRQVTELTDADRELLRGRNYATVVTVNPDGSLQSTVTWIDTDDRHVLLNTAQGRVKERNLRRDPRVSVTVVQDDDWYAWIAIAGDVVDRRTGPEADAHIDALSRRYDGERWSPVAGQVRVQYVIRPVRVTRYLR